MLSGLGERTAGGAPFWGCLLPRVCAKQRTRETNEIQRPTRLQEMTDARQGALFGMISHASFSPRFVDSDNTGERTSRRLIAFSGRLVTRTKRPTHSPLSLRKEKRERKRTDTQGGMLPGGPGSATCVQRFDDSLNSAIRITYRISLRSSSLREPRYPLPRVVSALDWLLLLFGGAEASWVGSDRVCVLCVLVG